MAGDKRVASLCAALPPESESWSRSTLLSGARRGVQKVGSGPADSLLFVLGPIRALDSLRCEPEMIISEGRVRRQRRSFGDYTLKGYHPFWEHETSLLYVRSFELERTLEQGWGFTLFH